MVAKQRQASVSTSGGVEVGSWGSTEGGEMSSSSRRQSLLDSLPATPVTPRFASPLSAKLAVGEASVDSVSGSDPVLTNLLFALTAAEKQVFASPLSLFREKKGGKREQEEESLMDTFVRCFFHHLSSVELWMSSVEGLFKELLHLSIPALLEASGRVGNYSDCTPSTQIVNLYHMFEAFDGLYEKSISSVEVFRGDVHQWLFRLFREHLTLPLQDGDSLRACWSLLCSKQSQQSATPLLEAALRESIERSVLSATDTLLTNNLPGWQEVLAAKSSSPMASSSILSRLIHLVGQGPRLSNLPFEVIQLLLENTISTLRNLEGEVMEVLGGREVMTIFFDCLRGLYDDVLRAFYSQRAAQLTLPQHLIYYHFFDQLLTGLCSYGERHGDRRVVPETWLVALRLRRSEAAQQACSRLVQDVKAGTLDGRQTSSHFFHPISCTCQEKSSSAGAAGSSLGAKAQEAEAMKTYTQVRPTHGRIAFVVNARCLLSDAH